MNLNLLRDDTEPKSADIYRLHGADEAPAPIEPAAIPSVPDVLLNREAPKKRGRAKGSRNKKRAVKPPVSSMAEVVNQPLPIAAVPGGMSTPNVRSLRKVEMDTLMFILLGFAILAAGFGVGYLTVGSL